MLKPYRNVLNELAKPRYKTWTIKEAFFTDDLNAYQSTVNVALRIDCDHHPETIIPIIRELKTRNLKASIFFLPNADLELIKFAKTEGMEVGLHSYHLLNGRGTEDIMKDVERMGLEGGGMTWHADANNLELYKETQPGYLGLAWHDGCEEYTRDGTSWIPPCNHVSDNYWNNDNGWNRVGWYPLWKLRQMKPGETFHLTFHTWFPFEDPHKGNIRRIARANIYTLKKRLIG